MKRTLIPLAIVAVLVSMAGALLLSGQRSEADSIELEGITADELKKSGVDLSPPGTDDVATTDKDSIAEAAREAKLQPGAIIREVVLARVGEADTDLVKEGQLVWVVNVDPKSVSWSGSLDYGCDPREVSVSILLLYMDANTGEYLLGYEQAGPLEEECLAGTRDSDAGG